MHLLKNYFSYFRDEKEVIYNLVNYYLFLSPCDIVKDLSFRQIGRDLSFYLVIHPCITVENGWKCPTGWKVDETRSLDRSTGVFRPCPFGFKPRLVPARINFLQRLLLVVDLANLFVWSFGRINIEPLQRDRAEAVKPIKVSVALCGIVLLSFHTDLSMQRVIKLGYSTVLQTIVVTRKVIL